VALAIAVAVAITANGIANLERGVPFWYGMGKTAVVGAVSGAISMGIGGAVSSLNGIAKIAAEAALHGISGGLISLASGGEFESGFFSGMVSSIISSSLTELGTTKNAAGQLVPKNEFGRTYLKAAMIAAGGLSGAISARIAGGNFWDGMRQGLITAGLNHVEHMVFESGGEYTQQQSAEDDGGGGGDGKKPTLQEMKKNPPKHPDYEAPRGGDRKVVHPRGQGWIDRKGRVWIPADHDETHAPHYDVQPKKGPGYEKIYPINSIPTENVKKGVVFVGFAYLTYKIVVALATWECLGCGVLVTP